MQDITDREVIDAMGSYGGSFVRALSKAALRADSENLSKIKDTWLNYWSTYKELAKLLRDNPLPKE